MRQLSFLPPARREYIPTQGKRKIRRPFDPKQALHVTLKSSLARGQRSLLARERRAILQGLSLRTAERHHVRLYRYANVGNHIHLLLSARKRQDLRSFLREFAGAVAVVVTGAAKGRPQRFWDCPPWSLIVSWGRQFERAKRYILLNLLEASGLRDKRALARLEREGILFLAPEPGG
jgi:REP element-mobilizing transposase RayT